MDSILLTIAIPTFNRAPYLKELLPIMKEQCAPYPEIEILVSDNFSTDDSFSFIREMSDDNQLRYRGNSKNLGGDQNIIECVRAAKGKYVWIFGDDDILLPGGIDKIMSFLGEVPAFLILIGLDFNPKNKFSRDKLFPSYKDFVSSVPKNILLDHGMITTNIFRRDIFNIPVAEKNLPSEFGHLYAIRDQLDKYGAVYLYNKPVIRIRTHNYHFLEYKAVLYLINLSKVYRGITPFIIKFIAGQFLKPLKLEDIYAEEQIF